jgi:hypothetical protein
MCNFLTQIIYALVIFLFSMHFFFQQKPVFQQKHHIIEFDFLPLLENSNCESDKTVRLINLIRQPDVTNLVPSSTSIIQTSASTSATLSVASHSSANLELPRLLIRELAKIRQNTAAYIAGFICRKILPSNCLDCRSALLGENITDIRAYIILKD